MISYYAGDDVTFDHTFYDNTQTFYDPPEVTSWIVQGATSIVNGPFTYSGGAITQLSTGRYEFSTQLSPYLVPGRYSARWSAEIEGEYTSYYEDFFVIEPDVESNDILDPPRTYGKIKNTFNWGTMGLGTTDRVFLVGHAQGVELNAPYEVRNMREAINWLGGDLNSPLTRGLVELYNCGARDIWLVASAPMSEYIAYDPANPSARTSPVDGWGGLNFYDRYHSRLLTTLQYLNEWDLIELLVVPDAPFYWDGMTWEGADYGRFMHDILYYNAQRFLTTGMPSVAIMGSLAGEMTTAKIDDAINYLDTYNAQYLSVDNLWTYAELSGTTFAMESYMDNHWGKFGMLVWGDASILSPQTVMAYRHSPVCSLAGMLSNMNLISNLVYERIPTVRTPAQVDISDADMKRLARAKINPITRTTLGKRGANFNTVLATDNLLSPSGSDYWAMTQMRLVMKVIQQLKAFGLTAIGNLGYTTFQRESESYLLGLVTAGIIKGYQLDIRRNITDLYAIEVDVTLQPYANLREIFFTVEVGPGES